MGSYKMCGCFTRSFGITEAGPPDDVRNIFREYADGGTYMEVDHFRRFMTDVQGDVSGSDAAERIVEEVLRKNHHIAQFTRRSLTLDDFHRYLLCTDLNPPITDQVHHDMNAPLSHYYIYTGHNSYLTGNQLSSACSDVPIVQALKRGVRVVELDLWPGSKSDVNVLHGRTLTKPVKLIKCLKSIKDHAFSSSPYPLIITLEDHLPASLQAKVAQMITETFGSMLYYPRGDRLREFPSPEDLMHRIIISTKPPKEYLEVNDAKENGFRQKGKDVEDDLWGAEPLTANLRDSDKSDNDTGEPIPSDEDNEGCGVEVQPAPAPAYKSLIAIPAGKPKGGLKEALKVEPDIVRRLSLSEQLLEKAVLSRGTDVVRFTQKNFLRIYPKGTRFNSSNYKPLIGWMHGAQMVAFNMQGYGRSLWLMHGMFKANGGCGYVKKPDFLINVDSHGRVFDPEIRLPVKKTLKVKVYLGDGWHLDFKKTHFDRYSPPDFYVKLGIAGVRADEIMKKTKKIEDNWIPIWNKEFEFPLTVPELALLRIEVHEYDMSEKDDFAGQTCLPVSELRSGIRSVPLFDHKGCKYNSVKLLMRFEFV